MLNSRSLSLTADQEASLLAHLAIPDINNPPDEFYDVPLFMGLYVEHWMESPPELIEHFGLTATVERWRTQTAEAKARRRAERRAERLAARTATA